PTGLRRTSGASTSLGAILGGRLISPRTTRRVSRKKCVPSSAVDAGPLIALFKGADRHHDAAVGFIRRIERPLVTNFIVMSEAAALISPSLQPTFLGWMIDAVGNLNKPAIFWAQWESICSTCKAYQKKLVRVLRRT